MYILKRLNITMALTIVLVCMIYFKIYYHDWFMTLFSWQAQNQNVFFIFALFYIFVIHRLIFLNLKKNVIHMKINSTQRLKILIILYFVFGFLIVIFHEGGFIEIKRYLIYLLTPMLVFLLVFGMYRSNKNIMITLQILFILGIILTIWFVRDHYLMSHGVVNHYFIEGGRIDMEKIDMETGKVDIGYIARWTIPGLGPNVLQSMLIPIVITGVFFYRKSYGKLRLYYIVATLFLIYGIVITSTRGAIVSIVIGIMYLCWRKWFRFDKKTIFFLLSIFFILYFQGGFLLTRFSSVPSVYLKASNWSDVEKVEGETRKRMLVNSLQLFKSNPILGIGFTNAAVSEQSGTHSNYLDMLVQGGCVVFVPFVLFLYLLYANARNVLVKRLYGEPFEKDMGILLIAGLLAFIVDNNFPPGYFHYYFIWYGFVAAWTRNCEVEYYRGRLKDEYNNNRASIGFQVWKSKDIRG